MPTLDWIGKQAVLNHHEHVPYRQLVRVPEESHGTPGSGNLLIEGDNLEALRALLPEYEGRVKLIYIDPPYNTGEEGWAYNDNVNSPEIREWLTKVVGRESEDLSRHDKWLCMMYPRLQLLRKFLREDGVICVSIDDNEVGYLRLLMDEIFGNHDNLGTFVWKRRTASGMGNKLLSLDHEYVLVYSKDKNKARLYGLEKDISTYPLVEHDEQGNERRFASTDLTLGMTSTERPNQFFPIVNPRTQRSFTGNPNRVWRFAPDTMSQVIAQGQVIWPDDPQPKSVVAKRQERREVDEPRPRYKTYYDPENQKPKPFSSWVESNKINAREIDRLEDEFGLAILKSGMNTESSKLMEDIFGSKLFAYPKPLSLLKSLVRMATKDDDIILDSFAGSGTTGHAVLSLNDEDASERRFILIELDKAAASDITALRMQKVIDGYGEVPGLGGGFDFLTLGDTLFEADGRIRAGVPYDALARYVFHAATGEAWAGTRDGPFLGRTARGVGVYLLYNGVLRDRHPQGGNVLTREVLAGLPDVAGGGIVYGTASRVTPGRLEALGLSFRQIPYALAARAGGR